MEKYYNTQEAEAAVLALEQQYPALAKAIALPKLTASGKQSHALHLSTDFAAKCPVVVIIAAVHGNEWGGCEIAINVAADVLKTLSAPAPSSLVYGPKKFKSHEIHGLLARRDLVIFPLVNPDGREFAQTPGEDRSWRKNRRPPLVDGGPVGVDINRNFDLLFNLAAFDPLAPSPAGATPQSHYYQGPGPFSEPETANVVDLLNSFPSTGWFIDLHCTGPEIRYAWSIDEAGANTAQNFMNPLFNGQRGSIGGYQEFLNGTDATEMARLAKRFVADVAAVRNVAYLSGPGFVNAPTSGTSHDYAYSRHRHDPRLGRVLGFYVEWGQISTRNDTGPDDQPPPAEMSEIIKEVSAGLIGLCIAT